MSAIVQILCPKPLSRVLFDHSAIFFNTKSICNLRFQEQGSFHHIYSHLSSFNKREWVHSKQPMWLHTVIMSNQWAVIGAASPSALWSERCGRGVLAAVEQSPDTSASTSYWRCQTSIRKWLLNSDKDMCKRYLYAHTPDTRSVVPLCSHKLTIICIVCVNWLRKSWGSAALAVQSRSTEACKGHRKSRRPCITFNNNLFSFLSRSI